MGTPDPSGTVVVGPGAPYITPALLVAAATGISWSTVPERGASAAEQYAAQLDICTRATDMVNEACNQPLRATVDVESVVGPGTFECQIRPNGTARLLLTRSPITQVISGRMTAAAAFPPSWSAIAANQFRVEHPSLGVYGTSAPSASGDGGQTVIAAPGLVTWAAGRGGVEVELTYINGWPHGSITSAAAAAATVLHVDDITGWLGAAGTIHDSGSQEVISVTSVTPATSGAISGPGTLTLATALTYGHAAGTMVTTLPGNVIQAAILFATAQALTRGATATTVQTVAGNAGSGGGSPKELNEAAARLVRSFGRVI